MAAKKKKNPISKPIHIRLTENELEYVTNRSENENIPRNTFIRYLINSAIAKDNNTSIPVYPGFKEQLNQELEKELQETKRNEINKMINDLKNGKLDYELVGKDYRKPTYDEYTRQINKMDRDLLIYNLHRMQVTLKDITNNFIPITLQKLLFEKANEENITDIEKNNYNSMAIILNLMNCTIKPFNDTIMNDDVNKMDMDKLKELNIYYYEIMVAIEYIINNRGIFNVFIDSSLFYVDYSTLIDKD